MNIKKDIGRRIRLIRAGHKMTQEQMAKHLSVSAATISAWEIGDIGLSIDAAVRVATFGNTSLDWLINGSDKMSKYVPDDHNTPEEHRLITAYRKLNKTSQSAVLRVVEVMGK